MSALNIVETNKPDGTRLVMVRKVHDPEKRLWRLTLFAPDVPEAVQETLIAEAVEHVQGLS